MKKLLVLLLAYITVYAKEPKIIGLMQVRNESQIIEQTLRVLALYTDSIVILDDASDDNTVDIVQQLASQLNIEKILCESTSGWSERTEIENRQKLLDVGRECGGTHFIELDADEVLTAPCLKNNWLRNKILALKKGQILRLPIINLWKSFDYFRIDKERYPGIVPLSAIFCDDGVSTLEDNKKVSHSGFLHFGRFPITRVQEAPDITIHNNNYAVLHLPFINWDNVYIKRGWIMCLERIRLQEGLSVKFPGRTVQDINNFYSIFHNYALKNKTIARVPAHWLDYDFFDKECYKVRQVEWRRKQVLQWFTTYGKDFFADLDIWHIDWEK